MSEISAMPEPLEVALTGADDRPRLNHWLPPQNGIVTADPHRTTLDQHFKLDDSRPVARITITPL